MVRGVGIASLICSIFGCVWILAGLNIIDVGEARFFWIALISIGVLMLITSVLFIARPSHDGTRREYQNGVVKRLRIINAVQWNAIVLSIVLLNVLHRTAPLPWVISIIVGIHFLPLGYVLRLTSYKILGISIIALDLAMLPFSPPVRYGYAALGTGFALLCAACFWILSVCSTWLRRSHSDVESVRGIEER
jgi:hypothetical protein